MAERRIINGWIVEKQADGSLKTIGQAGGQAPQMPADPTFGLKAPKVQSEIASTQTDTQGKALDNRIVAATLPDVVRKTKADADKAEADALKASEKTAEQKESDARATKLNALVGQINRVQDLFDQTVGTTRGLGGLQDYLPTADNATFDAAGASLSEQGLAAFRTPGQGPMSDRDSAMFNSANLPVASSLDAKTQEQLRGLRARTDEAYRGLGLPTPQWSGVPAQDDNRAASLMAGNGVGTPPSSHFTTPWDQPAPSGQTIAQGASRTITSDRLGAQVDAMMNAGASREQINATLAQAGYPPINPEHYTTARGWMQDHPGNAYKGANITKQEPLSLLQQAAGSAPGAFVANMANDITGGTVAALAGDKGRGAIDAMNAVHPNASAIGSVAGGVGGAAAMELGAARLLAPNLARFAPRISDTIYGGLQGFNSAAPGDGLQGTATGALAGLGGGFVGEKGAKALGAITRGVSDPATQYLRSQGVPMTTGQAVSQSGFAGRTIKGLEDAMTSLPGVGNMVDARRMEGIEGMNRAAFRIGGAPIGFDPGATGAEGIQRLAGARSQAYDAALNPVSINANTPSFVQDVAGANASAARIPNVNGAQDAALAALANRIGGAVDPATDQISGRGFQEAYRGLARTGRERANGDYGHEVGQVMREGQDALAQALNDQAPGAFPAFQAANSANRNLNTLGDAVNRAQNAEGQLFTGAQLNMADNTATRRLTGPLASASGDRPFYELANAAQAVLPSKLPDSGTFKRLAVGTGALGVGGGSGYLGGGEEGAATGGGLSLAAILALSAGGSKRAQDLAVKALMDRPELARSIGNSIQRNARIGGMAGAGIFGSLAPTFVGGQ